MPKISIQPLNLKLHVDFMSSYWIRGLPPEKPRHSLDRRYVVIVKHGRFELQFHSPQQVREAIDQFSMKIRPSRRRGTAIMEHYWQAWNERLPRGLMADKQRLLILAALKDAEHRYCGNDPDRFITNSAAK